MSKKIDGKFQAALELNTEKGGAWMATVTNMIDDNDPMGTSNRYYTSAWKTQSAAKKWVKEKLLENTPRKAIKLEVLKKDLNDKPIVLKGEVTYKVDA